MPHRSALALLAICIACLMFGLEISSIPAILPALEREFGARFQQMQWIMNAYTIAVSTVLMATGTLADRFGRKRVLVVSVVAFGATSLLCGLAAHATGLIAARFAQGLSGGAMLISQIAALSHEFPSGPARARAFGWWGAIFGTGLGFGPIIGGGITTLIGWQWVFLVNVPLAVAAVVLTLRGVHESKGATVGKLDIGGILALSASVFCLSTYITQGSSLGFASVPGLALAGASAAAFAAFVVIERKSDHPMFDFSIFRIRQFSGAITGSVAMNTSYWPFMIYLPIWFHAALGYDDVSAGMALLAYTVPTLIVPPLAERLSLRWGPGVVIPAGLFTIGIGFLLMAVTAAAAHPDWLAMLPGCAIAGLGLGIANTPVTNTTTGSVPSDRAGMASGIDMSARMISLAVNIAVMGLVLSTGVRSHLEHAATLAAAGHQLTAIAERIAAGSIASLPGMPAAVAHDALVAGFVRVMLYGAACAWTLSGISFAFFHARVRGSRMQQTVRCES